MRARSYKANWRWLSAQSCARVVTIVCILAGSHVAITQPDVWKKWAANAPKVALAVSDSSMSCENVISHLRYCTQVYWESEGHKKIMCLDKWWQQWLSPVRGTAVWSKFSLLQRQLDLYNWVLHRYPNASWIITVREPGLPCAWCCQQVLVLLLLAAQLSGDSIPVQAAVRWVYPRFQTSVLGYQPGNWFLATPSMEIHSQWTALTRHDAQVT